MNREQFIDRLMPVTESGCWLWTGYLKKKGYGVCNWRGRNNALSHRVAFEIFKGEIPEGMLICHKCDVPACCNPDHLFAGTVSDNAADMVNKSRHACQKKTHCPQGHEYAGENLYISKTNGGRECRACKRAWAAKHWIESRARQLQQEGK